MAHLALRLVAQRGEGQVILTIPNRKAQPFSLPEGIWAIAAPSENPADVAQFLDFFQPDILLWHGPGMRPALIHGAHQRNVPCFLLGADELALEQRNWRWLPDSLRATLQLFTAIYARNKTSHFRLSRLLAGYTQVHQSGPLLEECPALKCSETDLEDLSECLTARPVWLAAYVDKTELETILAAHRTALRQSPRLLLVLVPHTPKESSEIHARLQSEDWRVALWDEGEMPVEKTHILLAENAAELGLFYRTAPITLMGSSLVAGQGGRNPFEAAALGSAILYGPSVRYHLDAYSRLARAGGARIVKDEQSLSAALDSLMAPDKVAQMVHAGWETVSEGAAVIDQILSGVSDAMDQKAEGDAST